MVPGVTYKFNIINLLKKDSLYNYGRCICFNLEQIRDVTKPHDFPDETPLSGWTTELLPAYDTWRLLLVLERPLSVKLYSGELLKMKKGGSKLLVKCQLRYKRSLLVH